MNKYSNILWRHSAPNKAPPGLRVPSSEPRGEEGGNSSEFRVKKDRSEGGNSSEFRVKKDRSEGGNSSEFRVPS